MAPVWLITGSSKGFGYLLCLKALAAGHHVIAVLRNPAANSEAVATIEAQGGKIVELDMSESQAVIKARIEEAEKIYGRIDVLVNNAGYALMRVMEDITEAEMAKQLATNTLGPMYAMQAVIPGMRERKSGTIINISSVCGLKGYVAGAAYCASKFALEAISESIVDEVAPFNITVLLVELGLFRTSIMEKNANTWSAPYDGSDAARVMEFFNGAVRNTEPGDPQKAVDAIYGFAMGEGAAGALRGKTQRLMLGKDCLATAGKKWEALKRDTELSAEPGSATDFDV